jgi:hypothetical protein
VIRVCKLCGDFEAVPRSSFCHPCGLELDGDPGAGLEVLAHRYTREPLAMVHDFEKGVALVWDQARNSKLQRPRITRPGVFDNDKQET